MTPGPEALAQKCQILASSPRLRSILEGLRLFVEQSQHPTPRPLLAAWVFHLHCGKVPLWGWMCSLCISLIIFSPLMLFFPEVEELFPSPHRSPLRQFHSPSLQARKHPRNLVIPPPPPVRSRLQKANCFNSIRGLI